MRKGDRMKKMGEYTKMALNSPPNPENHSIQKERIHVEKWHGHYVNANGEDNVPKALEILRAISQKVTRKHIDSFLWNWFQKLITVLKDKKFKDFDTQE